MGVVTSCRLSSCSSQKARERLESRRPPPGESGVDALGGVAPGRDLGVGKARRGEGGSASSSPPLPLVGENESTSLLPPPLAQAKQQSAAAPSSTSIEAI